MNAKSSSMQIFFSVLGFELTGHGAYSAGTLLYEPQHQTAAG
jgi:hypothetical protein